MTDFDQAAAALDPANLQPPIVRGMTRIVITAERNVRLASHVRTGTLRRSWTHRVEATGERGVVGTTVSYAPYQVNDPLMEGWDATEPEVPGILQEIGVTFFGRVGGRRA